MSTTIKEIGSIQFGILSDEEIKKMSSAEINKKKLTKSSANYTLYDTRLGPMAPFETCVTCDLKSKDCPGHFGYIDLNIKVIHPQYMKQVVNFLKCICIQCSKLVLNKQILDLWDFKECENETKFDLIVRKNSKNRFCIHCSMQQPKYIVCDYKVILEYQTKKVKERIGLSVDEIFIIFSNIKDDDIRILGFNPEYMHPKNFIIRRLPVLPPRSRPYIISDNIICDDDLTFVYSEIIKINQTLGKPSLSFANVDKYTQMLNFRIKTLMDNSSNKAKHANSSRSIKGIKERLCGKDGLIRNNLLGKRTNFSARTVIGPDPTLRLNEIAIPPAFAEELTFPEHINRFNLQYYQEEVDKGVVKIIDKVFKGKKGDKKGDKKGGVRIHTEYARKSDLTRKYCKLEIGDTVHRPIKTGDVVLLNRQPSLHKGSMFGKKIILREGKTIRMNLATTSSFNADFDGDEMNLFVPQTYLSSTELSELAQTDKNMIGTQASKAVIKIVQDALLSCYLMTRSDKAIPRHIFYQCMYACDSELNKSGGIGYDWYLKKLEVSKYIYKKHKINLPDLCGKFLFSLLLPMDFTFMEGSGEGSVKVDMGILYEGSINHRQLKSGHSSFIVLFQKEYSGDVALHFVNNVQFLANAFMLYHSFSIGIRDCISNISEKQVEDVVLQAFTECSIGKLYNKDMTEDQTNLILSKVKDVGMKFVKDRFNKDNNFISTIQSGSKGDYFNIAQIMGLLGQQNITGKRVEKTLNYGKRTLPHYPFEIKDNFVKYQSRGFVTNSFIKGLSPQEFWFHAMSGREGLTDTAMKTSQSGYTQRKMVKIMEDLQVKYDQTVRNAKNTIIQFAYGGDNLCGTQTTLRKGKPFICNVGRLVTRLENQVTLSGLLDPRKYE